MPRLLPPLLTLLLCTACTLQGTTLYAVAPTAIPQNSPVAAFQDAGAGKGVQNAPQSSPEPPSTATTGPDVVATLQTGILWATQTERAYERVVAAQTATQQVVANGFAFASQTAQAPASTATKAAQDAEATQQIAYITQSAFIVYATQNAPAQELDAAETRAQANTALFRAMAGPLSILVLLVFVTACLIYVIRNPRQGAAVEAEPPAHDPFPELQKLGRPVIQSGDSSLDTDTNPPGDPIRFAELLGYAVDGGALGIGSVMASKIYTNHSEYIPVLEWLRKNNERREKRVPPLPSLLQTEKGGKLSLTPAGQKWGTDWLYAHQPPSPPLDNAENSANNGHARDDNGVIEAGGVGGEQENL